MPLETMQHNVTCDLMRRDFRVGPDDQADSLECLALTRAVVFAFASLPLSGRWSKISPGFCVMLSHQNTDHPWLPATAPKIVIRLSASKTQCIRCSRAKMASGCVFVDARRR